LVSFAKVHGLLKLTASHPSMSTLDEKQVLSPVYEVPPLVGVGVHKMRSMDRLFSAKELGGVVDDVLSLARCRSESET